MHQVEEEAECLAEVVCVGWRGGLAKLEAGAMDVVW